MPKLLVRRRGLIRKPITISREGFMTGYARRHGILGRTQKITDLSNAKVKQLALSMAHTVGPVTALRMFQAQINYRARARGAELGDRRKFEAGKQAIERRYFARHR